MAHQGLLGLPTELLDRIIDYLDWDRSTSLIAIRPDVFAISLTNKHLRETALPHIFRNATLCLRWADGVLLEPALYHLRRKRPDLAQHIRSVFVTTTLGYRPGTKAQHDVPNLQIPMDLDDWLGQELSIFPERRHFVDLYGAHRRRLDSVVNRLSQRIGNDITLLTAHPHASSEEKLRNIVAQVTHRALSEERARDEEREQSSLDHLNRLANTGSLRTNLGLNTYRDALRSGIGSSVTSTAADMRASGRHVAWRKTPEAQRLKLEIDALAAVMLCLPATLTELVFEAGVHGLEDAVWYNFALQLGNAAMQVFGPRLESLVMATGAGSRRVTTMTGINTDVVNLKRETASELTNLKHLVFASTASPQGTFNVHQLHMSAEQLAAFEQPCITESVTYLDFWNTNFHGHELEKLVKLIERFRQLKRLDFRNVAYNDPGLRSRLQPHVLTQPPVNIGQAILLRFAIDLRRAIPEKTLLTFSEISWSARGSGGHFSDSALHWLHTEAIPVGAVIDEQREERLLEDFETFLYLWEAEDDGNRGAAAMKEWDGKLVDAAMCSRWKQFENVRRDKGEWTTL